MGSNSGGLEKAPAQTSWELRAEGHETSGRQGTGKRAHCRQQGACVSRPSNTTPDSLAWWGRGGCLLGNNGTNAKLSDCNMFLNLLSRCISLRVGSSGPQVDLRGGGGLSSAQRAMRYTGQQGETWSPAGVGAWRECRVRVLDEVPGPGWLNAVPFLFSS